jgi:predicted permease
MPDIFSHVAVYAAGGLNLSDPERPLRVRVGVVSGDFFATMGVPAAHGRAFGPDDARPDSPDVVVLSWGTWQREYGGGDVLGTTIPLNNSPYEVIGVMPSGFSFPEERDLWIPMHVPTTRSTFEPFRGYLPSTVIARTAPGASFELADARMREGWQRVASNIPREPGRSYSYDETLERVLAMGPVTPLREDLVGTRRTALLVLFATTGLLLLIACANVTNLLLSYGAARTRELAVRTALGASRGRIVRQLLSESVMLAVFGVAVGIAIAPVVLGALRTLMPADLSGVAPVQLDLRVLGFAAGLALITGILFGLWPAFGATRDSTAAAIKSGGGHGSTSGRTRHAQRILVGAEVALAAVLLVGAGLMLRSFERLVSTDTGMVSEQVATLEMSFQRGMERAARLERVEAALAELRRQPGIIAAGAVNDLPLRGTGGIGLSVRYDGMPQSAKGQFPRYLIASDGYFQALGIELRQGRTFTAMDGTGPQVAIISDKMASTYWPDANPIGRTFFFGGRDTIPVEVIGVVADVRESRLEQDPGPQMYLPAKSNMDINLALVVRGTGRPGALLNTITRAVRTVDPAQPVYNVRMMDDVIGASIAARRANTLLITLFGLLALLISALGVYAVTANAVSQRLREFGIRAALGATRATLLRHVGSELALVTLAGIAAGAAIAWAAARVMESLVYGITIHDPPTYATAPLLLIAAAVAATIVPALRAMGVQPVEVMRAD